MRRAYAYVWEYDVDPKWVERFLIAYGSEGVWPEFFSQSDGYLGTELFQDPVLATRFLTIDYFAKPEDRASLVKSEADEFDRIDSEWENATVSESKIGEFWVDRR